MALDDLNARSARKWRHFGGALVLAGLVSLPSAGQSSGGMAPPGLEVVRKAFAAAVAAKDRARIAKLSRFPLAADVYGGTPKVGEREFLRDAKYFGGWFFGGDPQLVTCLETKDLAYQADRKDFGFGTWYLDCDGNEYYFGQRGGRWAFVAYQNINE